MRLFRKSSARPRLVAGTPVFSADNHALGYLKTMEKGLVEIDVPAGESYWVSEAHIRTSNDQEVVLDFIRTRVDEFKVAGQRTSPTSSSGSGYVADSVLTNEEQMQQRERMERELAEQRKRLNQ